MLLRSLAFLHNHAGWRYFVAFVAAVVCLLGSGCFTTENRENGTSQPRFAEMLGAKFRLVKPQYIAVFDDGSGFIQEQVDAGQRLDLSGSIAPTKMA